MTGESRRRRPAGRQRECSSLAFWLRRSGLSVGNLSRPLAVCVRRPPPPPPAGLALNFIFEQNFKPSVGMRLDSRKIGVLITDGKSQDDIVLNSQNLRNSGIELYAIGESLIPPTRDPGTPPDPMLSDADADANANANPQA